MDYFYNMLCSAGVLAEDASKYTAVAACIIAFFLAQFLCVVLQRCFCGK